MSRKFQLFLIVMEFLQLKQTDADKQYVQMKDFVLDKFKLQIINKGGKCERCGYNKCEGALQFHHLNPNEKAFALSNINISKTVDMNKLLKEVDKCILLCANCHAEEHYT